MAAQPKRRMADRCCVHADNPGGHDRSFPVAHHRTPMSPLRHNLAVRTVFVLVE